MISGLSAAAAAAAMNWARVYTIGAASATLAAGATGTTGLASSPIIARSMSTYPAVLKHLLGLNAKLAAARSDLGIDGDGAARSSPAGSASSSSDKSVATTATSSTDASKRYDISAPSVRSRSDTLRLYNAIGRPLEQIPTVIVGGTNGKVCSRMVTILLELAQELIHEYNAIYPI